MNYFNKTLKNYLRGQGLTHAGIAERLEVSPTIVRNYHNAVTSWAQKSNTALPSLARRSNNKTIIINLTKS